MTDARAEEWRPVVGCESTHEVSSLGRVRSLPRQVRKGICHGQILATHLSNGYPHISIRSGDKRLRVRVHQLVAAAFLQKPTGRRLQVNHIDGNRENNAVSNLEWTTQSGNLKHAYRVLKKKPTRPVVGISMSDGSRIEFPSIRQAKEAGFCSTGISRCVRGERLSAHGYRWYDAEKSL